MIRYIIKRVLIGVLTLFILTTVTFFLMKSIPGNPFTSERFKDPAILAAMNEKYGLDKPVFEQYIIYLKNVVKLDFGEMYSRKGFYVKDVLLEAAPVTIRLGLMAGAFALTVGITLGIVAALSKKKWINNLVMVLATLGVSVPSFLLALMLMIVFGVKFKIFPLIGLKTPLHYVLPVLALSFYPISYTSRLTRSSMIEVLKKDYITLARSKGLSWVSTVVKHGLKNALLPVVTYAGPMIAFLMTGSFVIENLFTIPGIGSKMVSAIGNRDYSMIMGLTIFLGILIISATLISDLVVAFVDPRVKFKK
ncbi:MAG: ABC transporter permease [Erysipelotrichaceae bacterium]|nr:ABC transporter permease [Erysipelotrichaceae bacterium]